MAANPSLVQNAPNPLLLGQASQAALAYFLQMHSEQFNPACQGDNALFHAQDHLRTCGNTHSQLLYLMPTQQENSNDIAYFCPQKVIYSPVPQQMVGNLADYVKVDLQFVMALYFERFAGQRVPRKIRLIYPINYKSSASMLNRDYPSESGGHWGTVAFEFTVGPQQREAYQGHILQGVHNLQQARVSYYGQPDYDLISQGNARMLPDEYNPANNIVFESLKVTCYDSIRNSSLSSNIDLRNQEIQHAFSGYVAQQILPIQKPMCAQQQGVDCGVYMTYFMAFLAVYGSVPYKSDAHIHQLRQITNLIEQQMQQDHLNISTFPFDNFEHGERIKASLAEFYQYNLNPDPLPPPRALLPRNGDNNRGNNNKGNGNNVIWTALKIFIPLLVIVLVAVGIYYSQQPESPLKIS